MTVRDVGLVSAGLRRARSCARFSGRHRPWATCATPPPARRAGGRTPSRCIGRTVIGCSLSPTTGTSSTRSSCTRSSSRARGPASARTSDSEIIAALLSTHEADRVEDALADVMPRLEGAFSTVVMTKESVIAFRDPARPAATERWEMIGGRYCRGLRESCAFDIIGARAAARGRSPGEMIFAERAAAYGGPAVLVESERQRLLRLRAHLLRPARLDRLERQSHLQVSRRQAWARSCAREAPAPDGDVVIAVPDSGNPAARGLLEGERACPQRRRA